MLPNMLAAVVGAGLLLGMVAAVVIGPEMAVRSLEITFGRPYFWIFLAAAFTLERLMPVDRRQKAFSRGLVQDFVWFIVFLVGGVGLLLWGSMLNRLYERHLSFLTIDWMESWPVLVKGLVFVVFLDLLVWATHFAHHKIQLLWHFHLIHHSQKQMSFFNEEREHLVERVLNFTVRFFPLTMIGLTFPQNVYAGMIITWYTWFCHANIRTNLGPLKYILVTPQSHRVHHSLELKHWDKNFAAYFTLWDRVFGTFHADYDEYPTTGIPNVCFPCEQDAGRGNPLTTFWHQFIYPLRLTFGYQPIKVLPPEAISSR
jgi:sterol desaturase/sphingolipid hydroxylase (fatty acid hydroxylase superfamily)